MEDLMQFWTFLSGWKKRQQHNKNLQQSLYINIEKPLIKKEDAKEQENKIVVIDLIGNEE